MTECFLLEKCGFFSRYDASGEFNCDLLIKTYCRGSLKQECRRLHYFNQYGVAPSDHMMPDGTMVREIFPHKT